MRCQEMAADRQEQEQELEQADEQPDRPPRRIIKRWRPKSEIVSPSALVNMVIIIPAEFGATEADKYQEEYEEEGPTAQLLLPAQQAIFDKSMELAHQHMKPLYLCGHVNGKPMSKILVDVGAAVNIMPYSTYRKLGKTEEDLIKTNMILRDFGGNPSETRGVLNVELTISSKTLPTTFFIIDGKGSYSLLRGRDWIHASCCVPSTMHQCLIQWDGDFMEIVPANKTIDVAVADLPLWESDRAQCLSGQVWEADYLKVTDQGIEPISTASDEVN